MGDAVSEWRQMMLERARELAAKGNLSAWQISQRTGLPEDTCRRMLREER